MSGIIQNFYAKRARSHAARGKLQKAEVLFEKANDKIGLAEMWCNVKDFEKAVGIYESLSEWDRAADAALQLGDKRRVADIYLRGEMFDKAIETLEKSGDFDGAIQICRTQAMTEREALLEEKAGRKNNAATLYLKLKNYDRAAAMYLEIGDFEARLDALLLKDDLENSAQQCLNVEDLSMAAALYEKNNQNQKAAEIYLRDGKEDKAIAIYKGLEDFEALAELYAASGEMNMAAQTYEKVPGKQIVAAEIYRALVVLEEVETLQTQSQILSGNCASQSDIIALGTANHDILYANRALKNKWKLRSAEIHCQILSL